MAMVIGVIAGVLVVEAVWFVERRMKIDDPVGAIAVHGVNGTFGVLAVGLFANGSYGAGWNGSDVEGVKGLFWGDAGQLGAQLVGVVVLWTVIFGVAYTFFRAQDAISKSMGKGGIRSKEADELLGLDEPEMGAVAYPEFVQVGIGPGAGGGTGAGLRRLSSPAVSGCRPELGWDGSHDGATPTRRCHGGGRRCPLSPQLPRGADPAARPGDVRGRRRTGAQVIDRAAGGDQPGRRGDRRVARRLRRDAGLPGRAPLGSVANRRGRPARSKARRGSMDALRAGADDVLDADASEAMVRTRLMAIVRSGPLRDRGPRRLVVGDVIVDLDGHSVVIGGDIVRFPVRLFRTLVELAHRPDTVVTCEELLHDVWGVEPLPAHRRRLRVAVSAIRSLLGHGPQRPRIETVVRVGYRLVTASVPSTAA